jgi:hypothetical protein
MGSDPKAPPTGGSGASNPLTQLDKFKALARELGADEDEDAFKAKLRQIATAPKPRKSGKPT